MAVRAAGGRRTGCATPSRCEQHQHQQQQYSSSHVSTGAVVGRDRVLRGVVRDAVGFEKALFRPRKNARFGLRSEIRKSPFSIHRSDCIRIGLMISCLTVMIRAYACMYVFVIILSSCL